LESPPPPVVLESPPPPVVAFVELVLWLPAYPPSGGPPRSTVSPQAEATRKRRIELTVLKDFMSPFFASSGV
jgi:hypothetical protein